MYSRMKTVIKILKIILRMIVPRILRLFSQFGNCCGRLLNLIMPIHVELARDLGISLAKTVVHHEEHVAWQQPYVDVLCPTEKVHHHTVEEMAVAWGYQPVDGLWSSPEVITNDSRRTMWRVQFTTRPSPSSIILRQIVLNLSINN